MFDAQCVRFERPASNVQHPTSNQLRGFMVQMPGRMSRDCQSLNQLLLSLRCAPIGGKLDLPNVTPE